MVEIVIVCATVLIAVGMICQSFGKRGLGDDGS